MKKLVISALALLLTTQVISQDILTLRSGDKYEVKLLEITDQDLRFKMYNNLEGPLYIISRNSFAAIRYENGVTEELALQIPDDPETVSVNGYNISASPSSVIADEPVSANVSNDYPVTSSQVPGMKKKRTSFGDVMGAILVTGLIALDVAAEVQAAKRCELRHAHERCCNR